MSKAILILNASAGPRGDADGSDRADAGTAAAEALRRTLAGQGLTLAVETAAPRDLGHACTLAIARRPAGIFVGGGDGTASTAAGILAGTGIPLGVLPLGTLNHFARDLGFPGDWRDAVPHFAVHRTAAVDVGELNGRVFVNNCSLGAYPEAVRRREALRRRRGLRKWPAMILAAAVVFWRLKRVRLRGVMPGETRALRTPFVVVANNRYCGHVLAPNLRARLDEGRLWVYTTRAQRHWPLLRLLWQSLVRRIDFADALETWPTRELALAPEHPGLRLPVALDGEVVDVAPPLRFRIRPKALAVFAGPDTPRS